MYDWAEFRHFRYLLKVLEKGGFRAAAEELHTSQPNLTVQARQFQEHASIHLFRRLSNGQIHPTDTGTAFIALARLLLEVRNEVIESLIAIERGEIALLCFGSTALVDQGLFRTFCALHQELLPRCSIRPTHGDVAHLAQEILEGIVDAAIITLPLAHPDLHIEEVRRDRMVVCLREDNPLCAKSALRIADIDGKLTVLYHPQRHPEAHVQLLQLLNEAGISVGEYSRASHPSELQGLVRDGHGLALLREGTPLEEGLTTRPIQGTHWTVNTAVVYHKHHHPKTIPVLVRKLKRVISDRSNSQRACQVIPSASCPPKKPVRSEIESPIQLSLYDRTR